MGKLDNDGDTAQMQGSGSKPYELKNVGGVLSCSCPAWRNQSRAIDLRTCKHIIKVQGVAVERARIGDDNMPTKFKDGSGGSAKPGGPYRSPAPARAKAAAAPALLLATRWEPDVDPAGWWMSEKLDGVRAYWTGSKFLSRNGNEFKAPGWCCKNCPRAPLDGELWIGRGAFRGWLAAALRRRGVGTSRDESKWDHVGLASPTIIGEGPSVIGRFRALPAR